MIESKLPIHTLSLETGATHARLLKTPLEVLDLYEGDDYNSGANYNFAAKGGEFIGVTTIASKAEHHGYGPTTVLCHSMGSADPPGGSTFAWANKIPVAKIKLSDRN